MTLYRRFIVLALLAPLTFNAFATEPPRPSSDEPAPKSAAQRPDPEPPEDDPARRARKEEGEAKRAIMESFTPSEKIRADTSVAFPADI